MKALLIATLLLFPAASFAAGNVSSKEITKCAAIEGELARLDCYDTIAKNRNLTEKQPQKVELQGTGKWKVGDRINPVDDSRTVTLVLDADSGIGKYGDTVFIVIRCQSNKTQAYINWESYLGHESRVLTRIGTKQAETTKWNVSSDSKASFRIRPIAFIKQMMESPKLVAQTTPYGSNPITAIFDTAGLSNAIKPIRETCGW